jgi:signal transduction histidine kinase
MKVWHAVFYLTLALPTVLALSSDDLRYPGWLVLGLSLFLAVWYGVIIIWLVPKVPKNAQTILALVYLAGAFIAWFPLSRVSWAYYLTASSFYGLMWGTLPFGLAVLGNILLTGLIIWSQALNLNKPVTLSADLFIIGGMAVGWSALLALWMRSIMRESAERKRLIQQLEETQANLVLAEREAGILQERQRLAQEIHDTLAQGFTSIVLQLEAADQALPADEKIARNRIQLAQATARSSLVEARRLVQALRPYPLEDASLPEALSRVVDHWRQETGIALDFTVTGAPCSLHPEVEVTLLRAVQEGLANVQKHARARMVTVTLSYMEDQVALDIHDDGIGFDPEVQSHPTDSQQGGFGLQVMRQRVARCAGQVIVESAPGQGTTLAVQIPLEVSE